MSDTDSSGSTVSSGSEAEVEGFVMDAEEEDEPTYRGEVIRGTQAEDEMMRGTYMWRRMRGRNDNGEPVEVEGLLVVADDGLQVEGWTLDGASLDTTTLVPGVGRVGVMSFIDSNTNDIKRFAVVRVPEGERRGELNRSITTTGEIPEIGAGGVASILGLLRHGVNGLELEDDEVRHLNVCAHNSWKSLKESEGKVKRPLGDAALAWIRSVTSDIMISLEDMQWQIQEEDIGELVTHGTWSLTKWAESVLPKSSAGFKGLREGCDVKSALWSSVLGGPSFLSVYYNTMSSKVTSLEAYVDPDHQRDAIAFVKRLHDADMLAIKNAMGRGYSQDVETLLSELTTERGTVRYGLWAQRGNTERTLAMLGVRTREIVQGTGSLEKRKRPSDQDDRGKRPKEYNWERARRAMLNRGVPSEKPTSLEVKFPKDMVITDRWSSFKGRYVDPSYLLTGEGTKEKAPDGKAYVKVVLNNTGIRTAFETESDREKVTAMRNWLLENDPLLEGRKGNDRAVCFLRKKA